MNHPPQTELPPHACFSGMRMCSGVNQCPACKAKISEYVLPSAMMGAGLHDLSTRFHAVVQAYHELLYTLQTRGIDPATMLGIQPVQIDVPAQLASPQAMTDGFLYGWQEGWQRLWSAMGQELRASVILTAVSEPHEPRRSAPEVPPVSPNPSHAAPEPTTRALTMQDLLECVEPWDGLELHATSSSLSAAPAEPSTAPAASAGAAPAEEPSADAAVISDEASKNDKRAAPIPNGVHLDSGV